MAESQNADTMLTQEKTSDLTRDMYACSTLLTRIEQGKGIMLPYKGALENYLHASRQELARRRHQEDQQ